MRRVNAHIHMKVAFQRLLPLAVISLGLALAAACGGDDSSASPTPVFSVGVGGTGNASDGASEGASAGASFGASGGATQPAGTSGSPQAGRSGTPTPVLGPSPVECTTAAPDAGLVTQVAFGGDNSIYVPGEQVEITLILANCGDNTAVLHYPTSQRYDFIVTDKDAAEMWRSSDGKTFEQVEGSDDLNAYDRLTYKDTWDQKDRSGNQVPDGRYKVSAFSVGCSISPHADCEFGPVGFILVQAATATPTPP